MNKLMIINILGLIFIITACNSPIDKLQVAQFSEINAIANTESSNKTLESIAPQEIDHILMNNYITIANWNLQIFGNKKASNQELMNTYSSIIDEYDIIFIQEIRDKDGSSFTKLCALLPNYTCVSSSRAGRTSSKEQYGIIYKKEIKLTNLKDFNPDIENRWERPPIEASFEINNYSLTIYNIHTKPEDVKNELNNLENVITANGNIMILGDLNADCAYYNPSIEPEFNNWIWIIKNGEDTTVSATNCAYDRIILNKDANNEYASYGIYKQGITKDVSDHYLVWIKLKM